MKFAAAVMAKPVIRSGAWLNTSVNGSDSSQFRKLIHENRGEILAASTDLRGLVEV